ncbi:MAG: thymidylate kinase [Dehalococcoidia bacterium]|nr:thymidylate kinase [Dehalococcoidia bacterium]
MGGGVRVTRIQFYGDRPPGIEGDDLPGRLIVLEGTDGVGRSTQVGLLKEWLEDRGYAVVDTGLRRSELAGPGIERAKRGNTLDPITLNLLYATDFWDRLERRIVPALRAGMVALVDRYVFSLMTRAVVRGVPADWIEAVYGFALVPDQVIYLDIDVDSLLPRVLASRGLDYWESGQDFLRGPGLYDTFVEYQTVLLQEFRRLAAKHDFSVVDARGSIDDVFEQLRDHVAGVVEGMALDRPAPEPDDALTPLRHGA